MHTLTLKHTQQLMQITRTMRFLHLNLLDNCHSIFFVIFFFLISFNFISRLQGSVCQSIRSFFFFFWVVCVCVYYNNRENKICNVKKCVPKKKKKTITVSSKSELTYAAYQQNQAVIFLDFLNV